MSKKLRMSSNEERIQFLTSMRSSHMVSQTLNNNRIEEPREAKDDESEYGISEDKGKDSLKQVADVMYASTGDTTWLAF